MAEKLVNHNHSLRITEELKEFGDCQELADIKIVIDGNIFNCHRISEELTDVSTLRSTCLENHGNRDVYRM
jgi:hypothetical protein